MDFYERFRAFLSNEKIKISVLESNMNFSNGSLAKAIAEKRAIGSDRLEMIFSKYHLWNPTWLFKEQGKMYLSDEKSELELAHATIADLRRTIAAMEKIIEMYENKGKP